MTSKNPISFHLKAEDFQPATDAEKQSLVIMRPSVSFWKDAVRRLLKNRVAMANLVVILIIVGFSFVVPRMYPYQYEQQVRGSENLHPMTYSEQEQARIDAGERVFPHFLGTDSLGRDYAVRVMMGSRISLLVGLIASALILFIGSIYGSVAGFFGGWVDLIMMRIVDIVYTCQTS
jgi:oligopeptide transport system permease protein